MRNSDPELTAKVYTDASQLPIFKAIEALPWLGEDCEEQDSPYKQTDSQNADFRGLLPSQSDNFKGNSSGTQTPRNQAFGVKSRRLAKPVHGGRCRARTCSESNAKGTDNQKVNAQHTYPNTVIDSHDSGAICPDLERIVKPSPSRSSKPSWPSSIRQKRRALRLASDSVTIQILPSIA